MNQISVVIPAYNEEKTIGQVIDKIRESKISSEIIVVDNCSTDNTSKISSSKGAKVVYCSNKGKGYAMETGLKYVNNDIVIFLDADINNYQDNIIELLANPIIQGEADFVKSTFERTTGGIVTNVVVKPLLDILYPDMYKFSEPISGMIASKKDILEKLEFEKDYGVDIGILIDVINQNHRVKEVNIGPIENMSHIQKNVEWMRKMSSEIMRAILKRKNS